MEDQEQEEQGVVLISESNEAPPPNLPPPPPSQSVSRRRPKTGGVRWTPLEDLVREIRRMFDVFFNLNRFSHLSACLNLLDPEPDCGSPI